MGQLDNIKAELNQTYDTNIFRVGFMADSIWTPVGDAVETDGSHPPYRMKLNNWYRQIWDDYNYNKPLFRSIEHADWTHTGSLEENGAYPNGNVLDKVRVMSSDSDNSIIQVTGKSTIVIWLEGGQAGFGYDTGTVVIEISTNGVDYAAPSSTSLLGKKQKGRVNDNLGYDAIIDEQTTNCVRTRGMIPQNPLSDSYMSYQEIEYNNLNPETVYYFRISRKPGTNNIRLGGCYYFTGKTLIFENISTPGANQWHLISSMQNTLGINQFNYLLIQSTIYHDKWDDAEFEFYYKQIIKEAKNYCSRIAYCSCTPAAVQVVDAATEQEDENPSYVQGQNVQKESNYVFGYVTDDDITYANYPARDDVYRITINAVDYDLRMIAAKPLEEDYPTWTYKNILLAVSSMYEAVPIGDVTYPATFTRISGSGATTINITERYYLSKPAGMTRDYVNALSKRYGVKFIDLLKVFEDIAAANGETIETDGYPVTPSSPLYADYPTGTENYLSRYFKPNHWRPAANSPVYGHMKTELFNSNFKFT